jgi:hypothetical protein
MYNMKKILFSLLMIIILLSLILTGCSEISKVTDPCKSAFEDCNYGCGDGILNKVCKEKCTYDYNKCKEQNKG